MIFAVKCDGIKNIYKYCGIFIFAVLVFVWWRFEVHNNFMIDKKLPFGAGFNPPSVTSTVMALFMAGFIYCFTESIEAMSFFSAVKILRSFAWMGKHTLYIFLYHRFFLDFVLPRFFSDCGTWSKRFIYFFAMIFGSIAIEYIVKGVGIIRRYYLQEIVNE